MNTKIQSQRVGTTLTSREALANLKVRAIALMASASPGRLRNKQRYWHPTLLLKKRLNALKYLVHLVGDVYQPLHAGYADDRGGNQFQLQAFRRGTNLHALWDSGIINNVGEDVEMLTARLLARSAAQALNRWSAVEAAQQSCQIVSQAGFYPERRVGKDYIEIFTPVLEQQLAAAGGALASLLNRTLE